MCDKMEREEAVMCDGRLFLICSTVCFPWQMVDSLLTLAIAASSFCYLTILDI